MTIWEVINTILIVIIIFSTWGFLTQIISKALGKGNRWRDGKPETSDYVFGGFLAVGVMILVPFVLLLVVVIAQGLATM